MCQKYTIVDMLNCVNVVSVDDGAQFTNTTRLDNIEKTLRNAGSPWRIIGSGPLFRLYGRGAPVEGKLPVLVSSHADSNYVSHSHRTIGESDEIIGTFDNSITNAVVLQLLLNDLLPEGTLVAFTGDEENESQGAADVITHLRGKNAVPTCVIVLDITDESNYGSPFTIENWFPRGSLGLPRNEGSFVDHLLKPFGHQVPTVHHETALPDESWRYEEEGVHVFSLCIPTSPPKSNASWHDWMHDEAGVLIRADLIPAYGDAIAAICSHLIR